MGIDIFFLIMVSFGFYFGYAFGLMKVVIGVFSVGLAIAMGMRFTPYTSEIIRVTFDVNSPFLPFLSFLVTLVTVLVVARIVTKILEENVDDVKFNRVSQFVGGGMMALVFTFLYSILVVFFGEAHLVHLAYNTHTEIEEYRPGRLSSVGRSRDVLQISYRDSLKIPCKGNVDIKALHHYSFLLIGGRLDTVKNYRHDKIHLLKPNLKALDDQKTELYQEEFFFLAEGDTLFFRKNRQRGAVLLKLGRGDTASIDAGEELQLYWNNRLAFFCDSTLEVIGGDTMLLDCLDNKKYSRHGTSFFYKYIETIPRKGKRFLEATAPFLHKFILYMNESVERLNRSHRNKAKQKEALKKVQKQHKKLEEDREEVVEREEDVDSLERELILSID